LVSSSKTKVALKANQREFAGYFFAECQHLLNHAAEQRAHLLSVLSTKADPSPSWMFVSIYYLSLFVALAWTRVANKSILYLDKSSLDQYLQGSTPKPGAGAHSVSASLGQSNNILVIDFNKCQSSHFHDAAWISTNNIAADIARSINQACSARRATSEEMLALRGLGLFEGMSFLRSHNWQSKLRNAINYRPCFSYRSIPKNNILKIYSKITKATLNDTEAVIAFGEKAKQRLHAINDPCDMPNEYIDLLIAQTLVIEACVDASLRLLCELHDLSCSASGERKRFAKRFTLATSILAPLA
jgi:hypothetical protein